MIKKLIILLIFILFITNGCEKESLKEEIFMDKSQTLSNITIINIYDNVEFDPDFKAGFGFGCIVKLKEKTILFDTGGDSPALLANLETAGIKPEDVDIVFLSHIHGDHTGGLSGFLGKNSNVKIYLPGSFPDSFKDDVKATGAEVIEVSDFTKVIGGVYSTGELGVSIKEQSLIINSEKGLIIITGCAHPGIINIIKKAKELINKDIYLVMGGFHHPPLSTVKEFKELDVEKAAPSHCTGDEVIDAFAEEYKYNFIKSGVGKIIKI
jgi:7,8-dihydropterin-6-yl-methyl-4-(beta-D-ribofuranosyl)aminobenzene 5'-phosphate synthase